MKPVISWWCRTCWAWANVEDSSCVHLHRWSFRPNGVAPEKPPSLRSKRKPK